MKNSIARQVKQICFFLLFAVMLMPLIQKVTRPFYLSPLKGYFKPAEKPEFTWPELLSGSFQDQWSLYLNRTVGFMEWFARLYNQTDFFLFSMAHSHQVVVGIDQYLFEEPYLNAYSGKDFIGDGPVRARAEQVRRLQDLLWKGHRVLLVVVFPPDKGSFYPEKIPSRYRKPASGKTNYLSYKSGFEAAGVNFIDFNDWFLKIKDTARYVLYPKTGIHWSSFGSYLAFDSLSRYLEARLQQPWVDLVQDDVIVSKNARDRDADIADGMNLIFPVPHPPMAYPIVRYTAQTLTVRPAALFIGDSFYFTWSDAGYIAHTFSNRDFWYYDEDQYYGSYATGRKTRFINLRETVGRVQAIVIMQTNAGYGNVGYGFVDRLLMTLDTENQPSHPVTYR